MRVPLAVLVVCLSLIAGPRLFAQAPAPGNLAVQSATTTSVVLNWQAVAGASSYVVQRRAVSDAAYAAGGSTTTSTTFTDTGFDSFTAYIYRVFAIAGGNPGFASNEVTVGPPPTGFNLAAPTPSAVFTTPGSAASMYGQSISVTLDANGDPAIAFKDNSPTHGTTNQPTVVYFVTWDRANYKWKTPVLVDTVHGTVTSFPEISLAYDSSANRFGIAYESYNDNLLWIATSADGGATWTKQQAFTAGGGLGAGTALKMAGGQVYLIVSQAAVGLWYLTGSETAAPSTWTRQLAPGSNSQVGYQAAYDLALDDTGKPGVVYSYPDPSGNWLVFFWRPPAATSTRITTSNTIRNDTTDAKIGFFGQNPRIVLQMARDTLYQVNGQHELWLSASSDGGTTWPNPAPLPNDGDRTLIPPITFAVNAQGEVSVSADDNGGTPKGVKCGWPKLIRSKDLVTFTACNPGNSQGPWFDDQYPSAVYASNNRLYLAFQNYGGEFNQFASPTASAPDLPNVGVYLWREAPQPSNLPPPAVGNGGIIGNAGEIPGRALAPGQIIEIYGINLSGPIATAGTVPLPIALGATTAVTTTVTINGLPAPIFYVSPGQLDVQVPFEAPSLNTLPLTLHVTVNDSISIAAPIRVVAAVPGTYVVINADGSFNRSGAPARPGDAVTVYMTGLGAVTNQPPTGSPAPASPLAMVTGNLTATMGGQSSTVLFAGLAPGLVGLYQVNLRVPILATGSYPLIVLVGNVPSNSVNVIVAGQ